VQSRALLGLAAPAVTVEVHLANGLPSFTLVGLADVEVKEARERVRSALQNSGLEFPHNKRITVNLAPADLPKDSGRFDSAHCAGHPGRQRADRRCALAGHGNLPASCRCRASCARCAARWPWRRRCSRQGDAQLVLPPGSAEEAALVPGLAVYRARHLLDVVAQFLPAGHAAPPMRATEPLQPATARRQQPALPDLADVKGQAAAKRALEICAAGGHSC
jgi:magnesium chelatase family protein